MKSPVMKKTSFISRLIPQTLQGACAGFAMLIAVRETVRTGRPREKS
jgi:hypothetical protein